MASKLLSRCSVSHIIRKKQIRTTRRYHHTPIGMAKIQNTDTTKCWQGSRATGNVIHCWYSWAPKNWCFWTVVLEKTLESPLDCKEIQLAHPKGDQSWVFIGRTDAEAETPILWPPDGKSWLTGKDSDAGRDWGQEEKGTTEDEMAGWHHRLNGQEFW